MPEQKLTIVREEPLQVVGMPAQAPTPAPEKASFNRLPDPEGAFALSDLAGENPKAAVGGAIAGLAAPSLPGAVMGAVGMGTRAAASVADVIGPDIVGIVSPRIAHALRIAQRLVEAAKTAAPAAADTSEKMHINADDVIRIKSLMEQGISQGEAVKNIMNLRIIGKLP